MSWADFGSGALQGLDRVRNRRERESAVAEALRQRMFDEESRRRDFEQRTKHDDENRAYLNEQREALAEQRRTNGANQVAGNLGIGDVLDGDQTGILRAGGLGSNVEHQGATLPSRQMTGFLRTAAPSRGGDGRPQFAGGQSITRTLEGNSERDIWKGTPTQRRSVEQEEAQRLYIGRLPENSPARLALEYEQATGKGAPASMFPSQGDTTPWQMQPLYEDGLPAGALRFNQRTGAVEPIDLGGAGIRAGRTGRGQLPSRVQNWLLSLQQKFPTDYGGAQREFAQVMQGAPNETFDRMAAAQALRSLYAQPTGADDFGVLAGLDIPTLTGGRGTPAGSPGGGPRTGGQAMTRQELRAVAQRLGISEQEAEQQARQRGMQVQ